MSNRSALPFIVIFALTTVGHTTVQKAKRSAADSCSLTFAGSDRKKVKLRTRSSGSHYTVVSGGTPISVKRYIDSLKSNDGSDIAATAPQTNAIAGIESQKVTIDAYLLGAKFERHTKMGDGKDNDIHAEIGDKADWDTPHLVIEVPPGKPYCKARKALWSLVQADMTAAGKKGEKCIMQRPVHVQITGYVFLDAVHAKGHTDYSVINGGRGIADKTHIGKVKSIWEIHPVLAVKELP